MRDDCPDTRTRTAPSRCSPGILGLDLGGSRGRITPFGGAGRLRDQRGASAVEFALVCTILVPMMFGLIQYGLYFNDALSARQGVREGVRMGVLGTFPACGAAATDWEKLRCTTRNQIGLSGSTTAVKVVAPAVWAKGKPLLVCAMVRSAGGDGLFPMPGGGVIQTRTQMSIETDTVPTGGAGSADTPLPGTNWNWCV